MHVINSGINGHIELIHLAVNLKVN